MNRNTVLHMLTETSEFMMSFVIITKENNAIIIDGGAPADMPLLKEYIGGRHISAWILTHAHSDHISGFIDEFRKNELADFDVERVVYHFPPYEQLAKLTDTPCHDFFVVDINETLPAFLEIEGALGARATVVKQGDSLQIDECRIDFLFDESRDQLKADIVQMAHHGHMNVGLEIYATILPEACLWCAPEWLYNEEELPPYLANPEKRKSHHRTRMFGTALTRRFMDLLGVKKHYVTKDGTQTLFL